MPNNRKELLKQIEKEILNLKKSPLYKERIKNKKLPVIGEGSPRAKIMFIGEAPGKKESETGLPFCGAAGKILDELLADVSLDRKNIYITNIVKDRPPSNRDPSKKEIEIYSPFLDRQISIIKPKIIATLGRFSMEYVMKKFELENKLKPIGKIHGRVFEAKTSYGKFKIIPLYHPAFALYNRSKLKILKKDFKILKKEL